MSDSKWVYIQSEPQLFTVGFYSPDGAWHTDSDWSKKEEASKRVHYLNGCSLDHAGKMEEVSYESNKAF